MIQSKPLGLLRSKCALFVLIAVLAAFNSAAEGVKQFNRGAAVSDADEVLLFGDEYRSYGSIQLGFSPDYQLYSSEDGLLFAFNAQTQTLHTFDLASGKKLAESFVGNQIKAAAYDASRRYLYAIDGSNPKIRMIDATGAQKSEILLRSTPRDLAFNSSRDSIYVSYSDLTLSEISGSSFQELARIPDLEAPSRELMISEKLNLFLVLHEKWISIYRLSDLKFLDYLPLEGHPLQMKIDEKWRKIYVQLSDDDADSIAVFDAKTFALEDWIYVGTSSFAGRKVNASTFAIDKNSGQLRFFDHTSKAFFELKDAALPPGAPVELAVPPGVTPSPDLLINETIDAGAQILPNVEFDGSGNFVITWTDDNGADGSGEGVYVREFNFDTTPALVEYRINNTKNGDQGTSSVHVESDGDYSVIWRDANETDGDQFGVYMRMFSKGGIPKQAVDILVPQSTSGRQMAPSVTGTTAGNVIAAWSGPDDGAGRGTWMRIFNSTGAPITPEVRTNTSIPGNTWAVDVHANNSGHFVVVWRDDSNDRVRGRAYFANGTPVAASDFQAGPLAGAAKNFEPSVSVFEDNSFIVTWRETSAGGTVAQRFGANQQPLGPPFVITSKKTGAQYAPYVASAPDNSFVAVWRDSGYNNDEIVARLFDSTATPIGPDFIVSENNANDEFECNVAMDDAGNFVIVWKDRNGPTSIAARYFAVGPPPVPMTVASASPNSADRGDSLVVRVVGTEFTNDAAATFLVAGAVDPGIVVNSTTFVDDENLDVNITILPIAAYGLHSVRVTTGNGSAVGSNVFTVIPDGGSYPAPTVIGVTPPDGDQSETLTVTITGNNFANAPGLGVGFGPNITVNNVGFISGTSISANITIGSQAAVGLRTISVANPGGASAPCINCFTVIFNPTLYQDTFDDGNANDWTVVKGAWGVTAQQLASGGGDGKAQIQSPFAGCSVCSIEADVKRGTSAGATLSVVGWYVDSKTFVELIMNKDKGKWILKRKLNGNIVNKNSFKTTINTGTFYHVMLRNTGTNLEAYVDNELIITIPSTGAPDGTILLKVKGTVGTFDNVKVLP